MRKMAPEKDAASSQCNTEFDPTKNNIEAIVRLEETARRERTWGERISDAITFSIGTVNAAMLHLAIFALWVIANINLIPGLTPFDPFPFGILTLIVSSEGVFLAIFILISQNRMRRQADRRAHLDLQISILAEQELTMILRLQQRMCHHLGLKVEESMEELRQMTHATDVEQLVSHIKEELPTE
jgi:uncharacterized membrane protein